MVTAAFFFVLFQLFVHIFIYFAGSIMRGTTKTLGAIRNSLSASNPLLSQQLSTSAPVNQSYISEAALAASGSGHTRAWSRREQRPHYSSVCSVGETSTLAEEVKE